jgi:hypothetical protein
MVSAAGGLSDIREGNFDEDFLQEASDRYLADDKSAQFFKIQYPLGTEDKSQVKGKAASERFPENRPTKHRCHDVGPSKEIKADRPTDPW